MKTIAVLAVAMALQSAAPADIAVTSQGKTWTQQSLFERNIGAREDMTTAFPPHHVIGNIY